jgi:hypothetical protein
MQKRRDEAADALIMEQALFCAVQANVSPLISAS